MISKRQCSISTIINNGVLKHKYSNFINNQLKELYPLYEKYSLDETFNKLLNIYDVCSICGDKIYIFKDGISCKNISINRDNTYKKENECNEFEKWHLKYLLLSQKLHNFANNKYLNEKVKNFMNLYYPFDFEQFNFKELYEKFMNFYIKCDICGDKIYYFKNCQCVNIGTISNGINTGFYEKEDKDCNEFELIHKEYRNIKRGINGKNTIHLAKEKEMFLYKSDLEWSKNRKEISAQIGKKTIIYAQKSLNKIFEENGEKAEQIRNIRIKNGKINGKKNIKYANNKLNYLRKNNQEFREKQNKRCAEMGKKYGILNIHYAQEAKIQVIKNSIAQLNLTFNKDIININEIQNLCNNDICGTYVIKAKFKNYINTNKVNNFYDILVCKSIHIYKEIYWILRVISKPEKQNKNDPNWTISKWWYISNLYYDFKFILLTNNNGVSEKEALLTEAKYAIDNNMICDKEQIIKDGYSKNHSYWSL